MVRSSLDISKDHSIFNYLISKIYLFLSLITTSFATYFSNNYFPSFLITTSIFITNSLFSLPTNMDMKKQINMCLFMSMEFVLNQTKFDIDITNYELMKTIWKYKKKKSWSSLVVCSNAKPKFHTWIVTLGICQFVNFI